MLKIDNDVIIIFINQYSDLKLFKHSPLDYLEKILFDNHLKSGLSGFHWYIVFGPVVSKLTLSFSGQYCTQIVFENGALFEAYCMPYSNEEYAKAIKSDLSLEEALLSFLPKQARNVFKGASYSLYPTYTPNHPQKKIHYLRPAYENTIDKPIITIDANKFHKHWLRQSSINKGNLFAKFYNKFLKREYRNRFDDIDLHDNKLTRCTVEASLSYYIPSEMPCGVHLNHRNKIRFTNGRHRATNLINLGAPFITIQSWDGYANEMISRFNWNNN